MGKYSNVDTITLNSLVDTSLNEVESYNLSNVKTELSESGVLGLYRSQFLFFVSESGITKAINDTIDSNKITGSIFNLKQKLNVLKDALNKIADYQSLEKELEELYDKLYYYDWVTEKTTDADGNTKETSRRVKKTNQKVKKRIGEVESELVSLENEIDTLLS